MSNPTATPSPTVPLALRSLGLTWVLFLFLGGISAHQFYLGNTSRALLRLFTLQYLTVAVFIDLFTLNRQVREANELVVAGERD